MEELKAELLKTVIEYKMVIIIGCGGFLLHAFEYFMGNTRHKSLFGFLKSLARKRPVDEPKA